MSYFTDEELERMRLVRERMLRKYTQKGPPSISDSVLLQFMLDHDVEFCETAGEFQARSFVREDQIDTGTWTGWTPYGSGHDRLEALKALVANFQDPEVYQDYVSQMPRKQQL